MSFQKGSDLRALRKLVPPGSRWKHFKNPEIVYSVVGIGFETKSMAAVIVYWNEVSGDIWIRHHSEWFEWVGDKKRFTLIE